MSFDAGQLRDFEHRGWQRAAPRYGETFARATRPYLGALLDAAAVAAQTRLIDLACGPGLAAAAAAARGAVAVGADFSAAMIAVARAAHPDIRFAEAEADSLPFADASFEAAVSNFGVHHFPEPARALIELRRVVQPGGRVAFTSWAAPSDNRAWQILFSAISAHGDLAAAKAPPSGGGLQRPEQALALLAAAGFVETAAEPVERRWTVGSATDLLAGFREGTVRTAALLDAQPPAALAAITAAIEATLQTYREGDGYAVPTVAILARGISP